MIKSQTDSPPLYKRIQEQLIEMIKVIGLQPGDKIPSERELSEQLDASRMTIRHAVNELVRIGILERRSTKGTFLRTTQIERQIGRSSRLGLSQLLRANDVIPSSKLLHFDIMPCPQNIAMKLNLSQGDEIVVIERLRKADGYPFCIEKSHIPYAYVKGMNQEQFSSTASLYEILRKDHHIEIAGAEQNLSISYVTDEEANILEIEPGSAIIIIQTIAFDSNRRPIEYLKGINHPEKVVFKTMGVLEYQI